MTRRDLHRLTRLRLREARVLLANGNNEGAYYLSGLAVGCALKAAIARKTHRHDFPPDPKFLRDNVYVHGLNKLLVAAGLDSALEVAAAGNPGLRTSWAVVKDWTIDSRYLTAGLNGGELYRAITGRNGVLRWLRQHW